MKKLVVVLLSFALMINLSFAQQNNSSSSSSNDYDVNIPEEITQPGISSLLGYTSIDGQPYISFRLKPELSFGKLGIGLDIPVVYGLNGQGLRLDEYTDGIGFLRMIRYVRWGRKKRDNFYVRVGELRDAQLGFGMLINEFDNAVSFEKRKLGVEFDVVFKKKFGLEFLYSDITPKSLNLMGIRPYYKPFGATGIPIIKTFEIGVSYVTDHDQTVFARTKDAEGNVLVYRNNYFLNGSGINAFAVDMGFYIFRFNWLWWDVYAQAGYMMPIKSDTLQRYLLQYGTPFQQTYLSSNGGYGYSIGSDFKFRFLGNLLKINARAEKFWHTAYYIPRFFNFAYMLDKDQAILELTKTPQMSGTYARLTASVLDKIYVNAAVTLDSGLIVDEQHPATFVANINIPNLSKKFSFKTDAYYANITSLKQLVHLGSNAIFNTQIGYMVYELPVVHLQFYVGLNYHWTLATITKLALEGTAQDWFRQTSYITPYFKILYPMNRKKNKKKPTPTSEEEQLLN
jgi:hypothetical protein